MVCSSYLETNTAYILVSESKRVPALYLGKDKLGGRDARTFAYSVCGNRKRSIITVTFKEDQIEKIEDTIVSISLNPIDALTSLLPEDDPRYHDLAHRLSYIPPANYQTFRELVLN